MSLILDNIFSDFLGRTLPLAALWVFLVARFVHATRMNDQTPAVLQGPRLKKARLAAGLKQGDLAKQCGVGQSHISGMERGVNAPSIEMLDALAQALGVSVHWLVGGDSDDSLALKEVGREHILADRKTPIGLAGLAGDAVMCERLKIRPAEWHALRSLQAPNGLTREGYLAVLLVLRGHGTT
jgi:transcriptional regulator with XRE-family HTH domain